MIKIKNIKWETDGQSVALPTEVNIHRKMFSNNEEITNYLSDKYGFLIKSLEINKEIESITVNELIKILKKFPGNMKVFTSSDSECNSYSTLNKKWSVQAFEDNKGLALCAYQDNLDWCDVDSKAKETIARWEAETKRKNK